MLPANRRISDKLDGLRFLFIVQVIEKVQTKAQVSFCGQMKAFHHELFFEEFNVIFFTAEHMACFCKCNQGSNVLEHFKVHFLLYGQLGNKGNLCNYLQMFPTSSPGRFSLALKKRPGEEVEMFHRRLIHFGIGV